MTAIEQDVETQEEQGELAIPREAHALEISYLAHGIIEPDPEQPRVDADDELRASIAAEGIRQPIQVRPHPERLGEYMIIDGERRWRGAAGVMDPVPCIVRQDHDHDARRLIGQLTSNTGKPLTALEEARAYHRLLVAGMTQADIARALGIPRTTLGDRVRLMELGPWIPLIEAGTLSLSLAVEHLVPVRGIPEALQIELVAKFREYLKNFDDDEHASPWADMPFSFGPWLTSVVRPLCYPITKTKDSWDRQPEFDTRSHDAECDCGGVMIELNAAARKCCGNPEWWKPLQREARKATREKAGPKDGVSPAAKLPAWARKMPAESQLRREKYYYQERKGEHQIIDGGKWNIRSLEFDPDAFLANVDPAKLILVTCGQEQPSVATTDTAALEIAKASYADRQASRRAAYVAKRAEALGKIAGDSDHAVRGDGVARMLALLAEERDGAELMLSAAELLGYELPPRKNVWIDTAVVAKWAGALEPKAASRLATAVVAMHAHKWPTIDDALEKASESENANLLRIPMRWPGTAPERDAKSEPAAAPDLACIGCGCTEDNACEGGCAWLAVDKKRNVGVCSSCAEDKAAAREMLKADAKGDRK